MSRRALLFTDIVDSTQLVRRLGDEAAVALWTEHDRLARNLLAEHDGLEIDRSDGFFMLFDDVAAATRFAMGYCAALEPLSMTARVGIHYGTVTLRQNPPDAIARGAKALEVEGLAKPLAARVMGLAAGGQVLLTDAAAHALQPDMPTGLRLHGHGSYRLKGIDEPVALFEVGAAHGGFVPPGDAEKAYRVVRDGDLWRPVREIRHNLGPERDSFIGRGAELRQLAQRLEAGARLVSVLGVGGIGKTRLVRRYAMAWLGEWPGGVYFCDLSEARSLDGICYAVASVLDVRLNPGDAVGQLGHAMSGRGRCLVILDNFEQVAPHGNATVGRWLDRAQQASFLVTTRERLQVPGEEIFLVESLDLAAEAIQLFEARARAQDPQFLLDDHNHRSVAEAVRLLDGLPLAIELAAVRARVLSPVQIVQRLRDRFALLAGARGAAAKQATLKATIDWSWDLLAPWEQAAMAQCSVFEGGFTLDAAEAVLDLSSWSEAPMVVDIVHALVDKSLLRASRRSPDRRVDVAEPYFGMYMSIRDYASARLAADGGNAAMRAHARHGRCFAAFGTAEAVLALSQHGGVQRRIALALELDNLIAACRRAVSHGVHDVAVDTLRAAWEVLEVRGPIGVGIELAREVLAMPGLESDLLASACVTYGRALTSLGSYDDARSTCERALESLQADRGSALEGYIHAVQGNLERIYGRLDDARAHYEAALRVQRALGDRAREGATLGNLALVHHQQGQIDLARTHHEAALAIHREVGNRVSEGAVFANLGMLHVEQGRFDEAIACYETALAISREVGNRQNEGTVMGNLGNAYFERGDIDRAAACLEAALAIFREVGNRLSEGVNLGNLSTLLGRAGRTDEAETTCRAALEIAREVGDLGSEGHWLATLGALLGKGGRLEEALAHCDQGLALIAPMGDPRSEGNFLGVRGDLLGRLGRFDEARVAFRAGEALLAQVGDHVARAKLVCGRGRLDALEGDGGAARAALMEAEAIAHAAAIGTESELARDLDELRARLDGANAAAS